MRFWTSVFAAIVLCVGLVGPVSGVEEQPAEAESDFADPLGRDTPRSSVQGFLEAAAEDDFERAAQYLDLRNLPATLREYEPEKLARALNLVLERATWLDFPRLSDDPAGSLTDGLPSYRDVLDTLITKEGEVELWLQRVPSETPDGQLVWKISNRSVAKLPELYDEYRFSPPVEYLRARLPDVRFLGVEFFKWVWSLSVGLATYLILLALVRLFTRSALRREIAWAKPLRRFLEVPAAISASLLVAAAVMRSLGFGLEARRIAELQTVTLILLGWVLFTGIDLFRDIYIENLKRHGREGTGALIRPVAGALKAVLGVLLFVTWLDNAGYDIGALLAGLGIGGVAVALVLQKPLEDVFAAFTLFTQQPIRIGDFGRFGPLTGTVEDISLRTTRIRTLENTLIAVPNAKFAAEPIENITARQKILYRPRIRLSYETSSDQAETILGEIDGLLSEHPRVRDESRRVRLVQFGAFAIELEGFAYIDTTDFPEYLAIAEELNLAIMNIVEAAGARFAQLSENALKRAGAES